MPGKPIQIIDFLKSIFPANCHARIFLVGGIVRDFLSGRENRDIDLIAALRPEELISVGFHLVRGKTTSEIWFKHYSGYGTIELTALPDTSYLATELSRRDFTVNSIAMDMDGIIVDPMGGTKDHKLGLLKVCSADSFNDDPLRIFRALRFEADGWKMTAGSEELIRNRDWSRSLDIIPIERFAREMLKALESEYPERYFQRMLELGVGENFLPELFLMQQIPAGPIIHHPEGDLFTHCCQVLQRVSNRSPDPLTRFCAFFHDIGKLVTDKSLYPKHHGHDRAGYGLARAFCDRLRLPATYRNALAWASQLHGKLNLWDKLRDTTKLKVAQQALKGGIAEILPLISVADKADCCEHVGWNEALRVSGMTTTELGITTEKMNELSAGKRAEYLFQKKVDMFRATMVKLSEHPHPTPGLKPIP